MPKFVLKEMESLYIEEMNQAISTLKSNLGTIHILRNHFKGRGGS